MQVPTYRLTQTAATLTLALLALAVPPAARTARATPPPAQDASEGAEEELRFLSGLVDKGLFDLAVQEGEKFLAAHPDDARAPLARYRLASALFELGREDEAAPHFRRLAARAGFEYALECSFRLGQCELSAGHLDAARAAFATVLAGDQDYLREPATWLAGETELRAERYDEAERLFQRLLKEHPGSEHAADAARGLAWCAWGRKDAAATVERIRSVLGGKGASDADDELRVLEGEALLELGRAQEALAAYRSVDQQKEKASGFEDAALRGAGFARAALGDPAGAAAEFAALLQRFPQSRYAAEARLQRGVQMLEAGKPQEAASSLEGAQDDPETLYWLGRARRAAGDEAGALQALDGALQHAPADELRTRIQVARGELLGAQGKEDEALAAFEKAGSDYALYSAAVTALNGADAPSAGRLARTLLERWPKSEYAARAHVVLGEALFAAKDWKGAEAELAPLVDGADAALAARALSRVAWCRYQQKDAAGAAQGFGALVQRFPAAPEADEALYMQGRALAEAGREDEAARARESYLRQRPEGAHADEVLLAWGRATAGPAGEGRLAELVDRHAASPLVPTALLALGDRLADDGRFADAEARYRTLLAEHTADPLVPRARYALAWCLFRDGDDAAAARELDALDRAMESGKEQLDGDLRLSADELAVWARSRAGQLDRAQAAWERFLAECQDDARRLKAARALVAACRAAKADDRARDVLDGLLKELHDPAVAVSVLIEGAWVSLDAGDVDRAEAQVRVALRRTQDHEAREAAFHVGEALFAAGRDQRAVELYRVAAEDEELAPDALYRLGFALLRAGDAAGAEKAFAELVAKHRESELWGEALFLLGEARFRQERWSAAAEPLERLRRELPDHEVLPKALFRLGLALGHAGDWAGADDALSELARRFPSFENRLEGELWRGRALAAEKKPLAARQAFERVVAGDQGELAAAARLGLGGLLEDDGRTEEALSEYLKVAVLYAADEEVAEGLLRAGLCLERLGQPAKAAEQYREVLSAHAGASAAARAKERLDALGAR